MAGPSRKKNGKSPEGEAGAAALPGDIDLETLYGSQAAAVGAGDDELFGFGEDGDEQPLDLVPPVRLAERTELAAEALRVPLLDHAVRLARWVAPFRSVDEWGEPAAELERRAAAELGFGEGDVGIGEVARAWALAVDLELIEVGEASGGEGRGVGEPGGEVARPGETLAALESGDPEAVLDAWLTAADLVAATAVEAEPTPDLDPDFAPDLRAMAEPQEPGADPTGGPDWDADEVADAEADDLRLAEYAQLDEAREEAQSLLDDALQALYETQALAASEEQKTLPLAVLAAMLLVPEGEEPTPEMLEGITSVMVSLDPMLQDLADVGVLDYRPIDPSLFESVSDDDESDGASDDTSGGAPGAASDQERQSGSVEFFDPDAELDEEEAARFGLVRLTPLGVYGVRQWLIEDGYDAPLIGAHAGGTGVELLDAVCSVANVIPEEEIREWLSGREPLPAAAELLAAARGDDLVAPMRRMLCALALGSMGPEVEPALREVIGDPELTGLATVWLTERGAADVAVPERPIALWTMVDALAAQLIDVGAEEEGFREMVLHLTAEERPADIFGELWRVDHPYTTAVLEAVGEQHPDRSAAKEARKAAYKARSLAGSRPGG